MTQRNRIAYVVLEVSTWAGRVPGASHYFGTLVGCTDNDNPNSYKRVDVDYILTEEDAALLNDREEDDMRFYEAGDYCLSFLRRGLVEKRAKEVYREHFPDAVALFAGSFACADPMKVLDGPEWFVKNARDYYYLMEDLGWYEGTPEQVAEADGISNLWRELVNVALVNPETWAKANVNPNTWRDHRNVRPLRAKMWWDLVTEKGWAG